MASFSPDSTESGGLQAEIRRNPSPMLFWRVWFTLGLQSFGGGTATLTLIRRAHVEEHRWIAEDEFTRMWALVQIAPGINLLGLTILIGRKVAGLRGILLALSGLLLPSVTVTILLTAAYAQVRQFPLIHAAIQGMIPATVGLGLLTTAQMARPLLIEARREGRSALVLTLALLAGSAFVANRWPVLLILFLAGAIGGLGSWLRHSRKAEPTPP